jgi:large subunit ribosomal protein L29
MKSTELRVKAKGELVAELVSTEKELFNLRMQKDMGGAEARVPLSHRFKQMRRKIARIKTILNEKTRENHE